MPATAATPSTFLRCTLCKVLLREAKGDNKQTGRCVDHLHTPAKVDAAKVATKAAPGPKPIGTPPAFTAAEASLIAATGSHLPAEDLLRLLNDRLVADRGAGVIVHTVEQLRQQIENVKTRSADQNWSAQRRRLSKARTDGVLQKITPEMIDDFAIVFQLSAAQVTHLREAIGSAQED